MRELSSKMVTKSFAMISAGSPIACEVVHSAAMNRMSGARMAFEKIT